MKRLLKGAVKKLARRFRVDVVRYPPPFPSDFDQTDIDTIGDVISFTGTSPERIVSLCAAVRYVVANNIPGGIVECGVWKGGSMMAVARTLLSVGDTTRHLYLYDTFEGMPRPTENDVSYGGEVAIRKWERVKRSNGYSDWVYSSLEDVRKALYSVGYPKDLMHFIKGKVEETIPGEAPQSISILRLDTDWYESTYHELVHLFPRVSSGGVLILDDYGHWMGARKATDEYIQENSVKILLNRIDYTGRIGVKL